MAERLITLFSIKDSFESSMQEFEIFTGNKLSIPNIQNHVEELGEEISIKAKSESKMYEDIKLPSNGIIDIKDLIKNRVNKEIIYVGVDGTGVPTRAGKTREAKVGIIFKEESKWKLGKKRNQIVDKKYVATLEDVDGFIPLLFKSYVDITEGSDNYVVACLGDGAYWIWKRFSEIFPNRIEILDFYHVSEYIWDVSKSNFTNDNEIKEWSEIQLNKLKESKLNLVVDELTFMLKITDNLLAQEHIKKALSYFDSHKNRMDYKSYLEAGLVIGSGVIESSNKLVVTKRLKQGGMHWSIAGAESIIFLRALYCSSGNEWNSFWEKKCA
jgi:hypothetical protein